MIKHIIEMLLIAIGYKTFKYPHGVWCRSLLGIAKTPFALFWTLYSEVCLIHSKHDIIANIADRKTYLLYYKGLSLFVQGKFKDSIDCLEKYHNIYPNHWESIYLCAEAYMQLGKKNKAFSILIPIAFRKKTWIKLANLVDNKRDFFRILNIYRILIKKRKIKKYELQILESLSAAALRCNLYEYAEKIWIEIIKNCIPIKKKSYNLNKFFAEEALIALEECLNKVGIPIFIISGTLLGIIRNGTFLSHDTDLDTGIFDGFDKNIVLQAILNANCFFILPIRSPHCLRIRHVNGTPIDIFTHYREKNDFWHAGVKMSWHNSPFGIDQILFHNHFFYIPKPCKIYLEENYGKNWRIPQKKFDSAVDCPNSKIVNIYEYKIHLLKKNFYNQNN